MFTTKHFMKRHQERAHNRPFKVKKRYFNYEKKQSHQKTEIYTKYCWRSWASKETFQLLELSCVLKYIWCQRMEHVLSSMHDFQNTASFLYWNTSDILHTWKSSDIENVVLGGHPFHDQLYINWHFGFQSVWNWQLLNREADLCNPCGCF